MNLFIRQRCRLNALVCCFFSFLFSLMAVAATDVPGSSDLPGIPRYPLSYIVDYQQQPVPEYRLALGPMRKINGVISPERERYVEGMLTRITYRIPAGHTSKEAFDYLFRSLALKPDQVLYQCAGRDCGPSNQWANAQLGIARLYGIDREQFYLLAQLEGERAGYLVAYAIRRGNRRVYLQVDHVRPPTEEVGSDPISLVLLLSEGRRVYLGLEPSESQVQDLAQALGELLEGNSDRQVWLVGHTDWRGDPGARGPGRAAARRLGSRLAALGLPGERLHVEGVGFLAPAYDRDVPDRRIEVLVR
ncbi:DUF4892 domain-containing protein [Motiliproteus sp. SC1-56]|uniref:DUF4892 domain-containing protein n=1 Tax=Motiliproteus sp. SC1-56 TaxID=2799565 RepID=UPI001A907455|nr:DUF4892 domain-containing protein [Motiliproteus sp. SC1-56]